MMYLTDSLTGEVVSDGYHEITSSPFTGYLFGKRGAMTYLIDSRTGKKVSHGYHEIGMERGSFAGKTGTSEQTFTPWN